MSAGLTGLTRYGERIKAESVDSHTRHAVVVRLIRTLVDHSNTFRTMSLPGLVMSNSGQNA